MQRSNIQTNKYLNLSHLERLASANSLFLRNLDEWIHLVILHERGKGVPLGDDQKEEVKVGILNSYNDTLRARIDSYLQMSQIATKQGYQEEAERYMLIAEIYYSFLYSSEADVKSREFFDRKQMLEN